MSFFDPADDASGARGGNDSPLTELLGSLREVADPYEFERIWDEALAIAASAQDRDLVFTIAASRLPELSPASGGSSGFDRTWLRRLAQEISDLAPSPLSPALEATAQRVVLGAVFEAEHDLHDWREAKAQGRTILDFIRQSPRAVSSLRDLGRLVRRLRGAGILTLVGSDTVDELVDFDELLSRMANPNSSPVGEWMRVTRDDLLLWADTPGAPHQLPALVRRLVRETTRGIAVAHFPGGSGVALGGWDGLVEADTPSSYVPAGQSGWELSVEKKSQPKAVADFEARVAGLPAEEKRRTTFVEVICRPWTKSLEFRVDAEKLNEFAAVRAYNADDLEAWLEQAPATTIWFNEIIERPINGLRTLGEEWQRWLSSTEPPLDSTVVLAGRAKAAEDVKNRSRSGPGITTVGGDARLEEILGFFGAAWHTADSIEDLTLSELIVVDDAVSARRLLQLPGSLLLLLTRIDLAKEVPPATNHRVFVAVPGADRAEITLPAIDQRVVAEHLREGGMQSRAADDHGALARRSLLALRRRLALQPELHRPEWANGAAPLHVRRSLLFNAWNRGRSADRGAIQRLFGEAPEDVEEELRPYTRTRDDPFIALLDDRWHVVSLTDSWLLLGNQISAGDLEVFAELAVSVLAEPDPLLSLADTERWRASIDGVEPGFSSHLRRAIARSLALLGSLGIPSDLAAGRSGSTVAREIVWTLLQQANADTTFITWNAIASELPLLAEGAPAEVLQALRDGLASDPAFMQQMFTDQEAGSFGSSPRSQHSHFLWALESLAWSIDYFDESVDVLADLDSVDPGGKWSNRPRASLKSILCPWHPNTSASWEQRMAALNRIRTRHPELAWDVMLSMLPNAHIAQIVQQGPEYRDWKVGEPVVTTNEYYVVVDAVSQGLLQDADANVERWVAVIDRLDNISWERHEELRSRLSALAVGNLDDSDRDAIGGALRKFVAHHREFADATWAMPEAFLATLDPLVDAFQPTEARRRYQWLFDSGMIELGDIRRRDDHADYDRELNERRRDAIGEIFAESGLAGVLAFAGDAAFPGQVGLALAAATNDSDIEADVLRLLDDGSETSASLAFAYLGQRFHERGWSYIDTLLASVDLSPLAKARLLRSTWEPMEASRRAEALGGDVATDYWREFSYFGLGSDFDAVDEVASRLTTVGRNAAALDFLAIYTRQETSPEYAASVARALEGLMRNPEDDKEISQLSEYDFNRLLKVIADHEATIGRQRAVQIEWYFLPALGFDPDAHTLHRALTEDSAFFAQMVGLVYRPAHQSEEERVEVTEGDRRSAENAFRLLHAWRTCPGVDEHRVMDRERLQTWVVDARERLAQADRVAVGDDEIGQALVAAPSDDEGWPCREVRDLIEELRSDQLERGFERRIFNNRGATSRALDDGGRQEWQLVEQYRQLAQDMRPTWSRLARVFARLAETYEIDARREDSVAERRRRGVD